MVEVINSSFIPKKEFKAKRTGGSGGPRINIFFLVALMIFLASVVGSIGVFLWEKDIEKYNTKKKSELSQNVEDYSIGTILEFSELDQRIRVSEELLNKHHNVLPIFRFLEENTLSEAVITKIFLEEQGDFFKVTASGKVPDLPDLYLQSKAYSFERNPNVNDLVISNIARSKEDTRVTFDLEFVVDKKYLTTNQLIVSENDESFNDFNQ